jgi:hypothetical protein
MVLVNWFRFSLLEIKPLWLDILSTANAMFLKISSEIFSARRLDSLRVKVKINLIMVGAKIAAHLLSKT